MATSPGDELEAAGQGDLRAAYTDRERVVGILKAAFVQGRLTKDELAARTGQALASRTHAELAALTFDLPAGLTAHQPPTPARAQGPGSIPQPGLVLTVATVAYAGMWALAYLLPTDREGEPQAGLALVTLTGLVYVIVLLFAGGQILADWQDKRSGRQLPGGPVPGAGGPAPRDLPPAGPGRQPLRGDDRHGHTADAAPISRPRLQPA